MDPRPRFRILDEYGQPLSPHIEQTLVSLIPKFQRNFPSFRDEFLLVDILEEAGRKIDHREKHTGPIDRIHAYAWVTLRSVATSRLRRGDGRLAQRTLGSEDSEAVLDVTPAKTGGVDEIERQILLRQVLETLTPDERVVCIWKKAGFSSQEIADRRGSTAGAIDKMLSRARQKVRALLGIQPGGTARDDDETGAGSKSAVPRPRAHVKSEKGDGK